jgi:Immunoglobulin domain
MNFTLALKADGTVLGWGANGGGQITIPANATNVIAIATGRDSWEGDTDGYSLALKADGSLVGWGNAYVPPDMPLARAISAGYHFGLALVDPAQGATPPTILRQPDSHTVPIGSYVQLSVQALGFAPLTYQWYFGTNALPGQTNHSLSLVNLSASQSGVYVVVVSNLVGATTSQPVFVNVLPGLNINMVPAITMFGEVGRTYRLDYINVVGPTNDWRTVATVTLANNPQFYFDVSAIGQPARFYRLVQVP